MEQQTEDLNYIKEFFINSSVEISISNFIIAVIISIAILISFVILAIVKRPQVKLFVKIGCFPQKTQ